MSIIVLFKFLYLLFIKLIQLKCPSSGILVIFVALLCWRGHMKIKIVSKFYTCYVVIQHMFWFRTKVNYFLITQYLIHAPDLAPVNKQPFHQR